MHNNAPISLWTLTIAALLGCLLSACNTEPNDCISTPGPNAGLSNAELLKKAAANMKNLNSLHVELVNQHFDNQERTGESDIVPGGVFDEPFTMTAKIQPWDTRDGGTLVEQWLKFGEDVKHNTTIIIYEGVYTSPDGGKTWYKDMSGGWGAGVTVAIYLDPWEYSYASFERDIDDELVLNNGYPTDEKINGKCTRKIAPNIESMKDSMKGREESFVTAYALSNVKTIDFWVTTDISLTIQQMQMEGRTVPFGTVAVTLGQEH